MKRRSLTVLVAAVALAFASASSLAQSITYQGSLKEAGQPANGVYDLEFRIFNAPTGGSQTSSTITVANVTVTDGLFTAPITLPTNSFDASTSYLDIRVRLSSTGPSGAYTTLTPRTLLTSAPTAYRSLTDRWQLPQPNTIATTAGISRVFVNTSTSPSPDAVLSLKGSTLDVGMYVDAAGALGTAYYGFAANGTSKGRAEIDAGNGGLFSLTVGTNTSVFVNTSGLMSLGAAPSGSERLQVTGNVRATGNINATGTVTASDYAYPAPQERVLTIPPEAFQPHTTSFDGSMGGNGFAFLSSTIGSATIAAPVYLPDGAVVTEFEVFARDNTNATNLVCSLLRSEINPLSFFVMAEVTTSGASTVMQILSDSSILLNVIDNETALYTVRVSSNNWDGDLAGVRAVKIRYTVTKAE